MSFGVYIHFPFCARLCPYCDFNVAIRDELPHHRYTEALLMEASIRARKVSGDRP